MAILRIAVLTTMLFVSITPALAQSDAACPSGYAPNGMGGCVSPSAVGAGTSAACPTGYQANNLGGCSQVGAAPSSTGSTSAGACPANYHMTVYGCWPEPASAPISSGSGSSAGFNGPAGASSDTIGLPVGAGGLPGPFSSNIDFGQLEQINFATICLQLATVGLTC